MVASRFAAARIANYLVKQRVKEQDLGVFTWEEKKAGRVINSRKDLEDLLREKQAKREQHGATK